MFEEAEADPVLSKEAFKKQEPRLRTALLNEQYDMLKQEKRALLIVVTGIDGAGKGATINLLNEWMDPRHIHTMAYGEPSEAEAQRPPLWRYWNDLPPKGRIGIVFGSWYVPLLMEGARKRPRIHRIERHAEDIRAFEAHLAANGVQILKLWFHLSREAQAERTEQLLSSPETAWQVTRADRKVEKIFNRARDAGETAMLQTDINHAPWVVIPSANAETRTIQTAQAVLQALRRRSPTRVPAAFWPRAPYRGHRDRLAHLDYEARLDKSDYETELVALQARLAVASRAKAFRSHSLILVFEGQDAAGKGGAIRRVTHALDARQYEITPISAPAGYELARPHLWRFWRRLPTHGRIAIFDRSWYGRVLVERVEKLIDAAQYRRSYGEINNFEKQLHDSGAIVLKFWLAVTPDMQLERFRERERSPFKNFKITADDWRNRKKWNAYYDAANEMFARTDTDIAPWHVISANDKRYARVQVLRHIVETLEARL